MGGAVIYTHPLTPPYQLHWMGATKVFSDAVLGRCADAFDVDYPVTELLWYSLLNLGNKIAVSSYTDCALGRRQTPSPGDRRVYCYAKELRYELLVEAIRKGRTFATNGGPVFGFLKIGECQPGDAMHPTAGRDCQSEVEIHSLYPLRSAQLIERGNAVHRFQVAGKERLQTRKHSLKPPLDQPSWYVLRVEDERGNWCMTSPIYSEPDVVAEKPFASAMVLEISNHTRFIELRREFFAHLVITVDRSDALEEVVFLKDGKPLKSFKSQAGNQLAQGKIPVTEHAGDYGPAGSGIAKRTGRSTCRPTGR